jgi:hypothetical protein
MKNFEIVCDLPNLLLVKVKIGEYTIGGYKPNPNIIWHGSFRTASSCYEDKHLIDVCQSFPTRKFVAKRFEDKLISHSLKAGEHPPIEDDTVYEAYMIVEFREELK